MIFLARGKLSGIDMLSMSTSSQKNWIFIVLKFTFFTFNITKRNKSLIPFLNMIRKFIFYDDLCFLLKSVFLNSFMASLLVILTVIQR